MFRYNSELSCDQRWDVSRSLRGAVKELHMHREKGRWKFVGALEC